MKQYDEKILEHYKKEAINFGSSPSSTMADNKVRNMETIFIRNIINNYVDNINVIADVGCGNGYTLSEVRSWCPNLSLFGLEFTPELRALAEKRFISDDSTQIEACDVRNPIRRSAEFDFLICQRVLINLLDPAHQLAGLKNIIKSVKVGGHIVFIEAFHSSLENLNSARAEFGIESLDPAHHNLYLDDDFFDNERSLKRINNDAFPENFLSSHYYVSRVIHPLVLGDRKFIRNSHFVRFLSDVMPVSGDYSPVKGFVYQKIEDL